MYLKVILYHSQQNYMRSSSVCSIITDTLYSDVMCFDACISDLIQFQATTSLLYNLWFLIHTLSIAKSFWYITMLKPMCSNKKSTTDFQEDLYKTLIKNFIAPIK